MRKITRTADSYDLVYERRRLERFDLQVPAKIEVLSSPDSASVLELLTKDICAGGAYFPTKTALAAGTKVKLDILLPVRNVGTDTDSTRGLIKVNGTVIRSGPAGMAIGFDGGYLITPFREAMN
ncbi:MAG: PilZ domain-containing protein [Syntrophaceae bacterium]|nr:PilZ domain-containing protein [Syntrophaceae bacterium]